MDRINYNDYKQKQSVLVHLLIPLDIFGGPGESSTICLTGVC